MQYDLFGEPEPVIKPVSVPFTGKSGPVSAKGSAAVAPPVNEARNTSVERAMPSRVLGCMVIKESPTKATVWNVY